MCFNCPAIALKMFSTSVYEVHEEILVSPLIMIVGLFTINQNCVQRFVSWELGRHFDHMLSARIHSLKQFQYHHNRHCEGLTGAIVISCILVVDCWLDPICIINYHESCSQASITGWHAQNTTQECCGCLGAGTQLH